MVVPSAAYLVTVIDVVDAAATDAGVTKPAKALTNNARHSSIPSIFVFTLFPPCFLLV
jgi:hypothetical protein